MLLLLASEPLKKHRGTEPTAKATLRLNCPGVCAPSASGGGGGGGGTESPFEYFENRWRWSSNTLFFLLRWAYRWVFFQLFFLPNILLKLFWLADGRDETFRYCDVVAGRPVSVWVDGVAGRLQCLPYLPLLTLQPVLYPKYNLWFAYSKFDVVITLLISWFLNILGVWLLFLSGRSPLN